MERTFQHSIWFRLGGLLLLVISLCATNRMPIPGEIVMQEGVAYREEGRQLQSVGDLERAAAAYQKAITVRPGYAEAYNDLGVVLESMGKIDRAEEAYKTALRFKPDLAAAHSNLALLYEETNRVKEAANHWGARVQMGSSSDPWVIKAREKLTKYNLPIPESQEALTMKRKDEVQKAVLAGRVHLEAGRWDKAAEQFQQALKLDPGNVNARKLLQVTEVRAQKEEARLAKGFKPAKARGKKVQAARRKKEMKKAAKTAETAREEALREAEERLQAQQEGQAHAVSAQAESVAEAYAKEKSQVRQRSAGELYNRALTAMREGHYQDAKDQFKQILTLDPNNREARQGLERSEKALARAK